MSSRKSELLAKGYVEDTDYPGVLWPPVQVGNQSTPRPVWLQERDKCLGLHGISERQDYLGKGHHFRKFCDCFFSDPGGLFYMQWNPNAVKIVDEFFANQFLSVMGAASCVSGDTRILNPLTGEQPTIQELCERREAPMVMTLDGPEQASIPFVKGRHDLYEICLDDGSKFTCTLEHRLLTPSGYVHASSLRPLESQLVGYAPSHLRSTSGNGPSGQPSDVLNSPRRVGDSRENYSVCSHPCDGQPHLDEGIDRSSSPSQGGAPEHRRCVCEHVDAPAIKSPDSHLCLSPLPPSIDGTSLLVGLSGIHESPHSSSGTSRHSETASRQWREQSQPDTHHPSPSEGQDHGSLHSDLVCNFSDPERIQSSYGLRVVHKLVVSIRKTHENEVFYDITVPKAAHYFAEGAIHHNSGKSFALACIAVGMYLLNPAETKVLVTSTTIETAKGKVWGDISYAWDQVEVTFRRWGLPAPGKKLSSHPMVRYEMMDHALGKEVVSQKAGIELIPTQTSGSEKQSVEKVQGYKQDTLVFLGDEWDTLPIALIKTVRGNLSANKNSKAIAAFNPTGRFTPGGIVSKPTQDWGSVSMEDLEWLTDYGKCIRFDAEKSENVLLGYEKWLGLPTREYIEKKLEEYGESRPPEWYIYVKAWFPPTGESKCIYSQSDIETHFASSPVGERWVSPPTHLLTLDPSFVHGGDRAPLTHFKTGTAYLDGDKKRVLEKVKHYILDRELNIKDSDKPSQIVQKTKEYMHKLGVEVRNLAVDVTGAAAFGSLLNAAIGTGWLAVHSSAEATELPMSKADTRPANEVCDCMMSEMWFVGQPLIRSGQIRGLDADTIEELCSRTYDPKGKSGRVTVESKRSMKKRTGKSPDLGDGWALGIMLARVRHKLSSLEKALKVPKKNPMSDPNAMPRWGEKKPEMAVETWNGGLAGGGWGNEGMGSGMGF